MTRLWLTADLHLSHQRVAEDRGYSSTDAHDAALADEWDRVVGGSDVVWVLGDVTLGGAQRTSDAFAWLNDRSGYKHLILGNHERAHSMHTNAYKHLSAYRTAFGSVQERQYWKLHGHRVLLSHFPYLGAPNGDHTEIERFSQWRFPPIDPDTWIVHGHTHARRRCDPQWRSLHVGWDAWGTLVSSQTIADMISEYSHIPAVFAADNEEAAT